MKKYYADTNLFLRYLLHDNPTQALQAKRYFEKAIHGSVKIIVLSAIILEIEYTLRRVYKESRREIAEYLLSLIKAPYFAVEHRSILNEAVTMYDKTSVDLVDLVLYYVAKENEAEVLSFDKDFRKLEKLK